jgi:hypothetical protein
MPEFRLRFARSSPGAACARFGPEMELDSGEVIFGAGMVPPSPGTNLISTPRQTARPIHPTISGRFPDFLIGRYIILTELIIELKFSD